MTKKQAKKIFEKYNPSDGVVRCPNGRAKMRKPLNTYARAAVNLYGIIKLNEFVEIFNAYNEEQTTAEEVYIILLPNVLKSAWYCFYKDYIVHYAVLLDFDWVQYLEHEQESKPRYIPPKEQFILFEWEEHSDNEHWGYARRFMWDIFDYKTSILSGFLEIKNYITHSKGINELGPIMEKHGFSFESEEQARKFFELLIAAKNNTRTWENKGYTPNEMGKLLGKRPKGMNLKQNKVEPNNRCPCGSGKKYKNCCCLFQKSGAANLSANECKLFYETWLKLLHFTNQKLKVVDYKVKVTYLSNNNEEFVYKISEKLWENPDLIIEYLSNNNTLPDEEVCLLRSWEKHFIQGPFVLMEYVQDHAVLMRMDKDEQTKLYAVKGITNSVADALRSQLPIMLSTVLIPFGDKIIYDSFISVHPIVFGKGMRTMFEEEYVKSKNKYGIITKL